MILSSADVSEKHATNKRHNGFGSPAVRAYLVLRPLGYGIVGSLAHKSTIFWSLFRVVAVFWCLIPNKEVPGL